jgi:hypothetical protein
MSIIYSYPTVQPTVDDLLIGTDVGEDNATKSFTVQSLVSLINAATGTGTVTSVQIATDSFLSATGGPIIDAGTITMGLAATGTPSASTFLRGDNQWVAPIVSAGITVSNQSIPLTTDVGSFNFIGQGVTVTNVGNDITVNVPLPTSDVTSILAGTGINVSSGTGNVTVSNSGVVGLVSGGGLTIVEGAGGVNTLTVTGQTQGTVTAFNTGPGLELLSGTSSVDPEIGVRYSGDVTYITIPDSGDPVSTDNFAFQKGTTGVKKGTFETLPISSITAVKTYVDAADGKAVQNDTDTYTSVPTATKVITLTDAEYTALATKDASTLYLTTSTAPTTGTVQFTIDQTGITTSGTCGFTVNTTCSPAFTDSTNLTNVAIGTNYTLTSTITPTGSGCVFTGTNPQVITGTVAAGTATVTQSLTGSVAVPPPSTGYATLSGISNQIGGLSQGSAYSITQNASQQSGTLGASFTSSTLWNVTATIPANQQDEYYFGANQASPSYSIAATYSPSTSTYKAGPPGQNVSATLSGTLSRKNYLMTYNIDISGITGGTLGTEYDIQLSGSYGNLITSTPTSGGTSVFEFGSLQSVTATVVPRLGFSASISGTSGSVTIGSGSNVASVTLTGAITSTTGTVTLNPNTENITGPAAGYNTYYYSEVIGSGIGPQSYTPGDPVSGTTTQSVKFTATIIKTSTDYTVTSQSFTPTTATAIVAGNTDVAGTLTGTVILSRSSLPVSSTKGSISQACASSPNNTYYLEKASGNTLPYAQQGDTVYTSLTGTGHPSIGYYKTTIENGVTNGYMYVVSNGLISIADPCDP